jgi:hypothetical protein
LKINETEKVTFQGVTCDVLTAADLTFAADGQSLLMATVPLDMIWPTQYEEVQVLYNIATELIPKHMRKGCPMYSFGVRQMGMGDNTNPVLKKLKPCDRYEEFQRLATLYYGKQEILERLVAPANAARRETIRDTLVKDACCAIPGAEKVLNALACSITYDYAPEMHTDTPMKGTLECIVFSKSDEAVFALKNGAVEKIVPLQKPMLILLDSKKCLHAAKRSQAEAVSMR